MFGKIKGKSYLAELFRQIKRSVAEHLEKNTCTTLVRTLVYCNFLREVRLGGWGSEGPKGPTLGQYVSACATIPLGSGSM